MSRKSVCGSCTPDKTDSRSEYKNFDPQTGIFTASCESLLEDVSFDGADALDLFSDDNASSLPFGAIGKANREALLSAPIEWIRLFFGLEF